jgi:hypothetical protein
LVEEIREEKWENLRYYDYEELKCDASSAALLQTQNNEKGVGVELEEVPRNWTLTPGFKGPPGLT